MTLALGLRLKALGLVANLRFAARSLRVLKIGKGADKT